MGFLDRLFGGRAKTAEETRFPGEKMVVKAPMDGIVLPLEQLPDETFAAVSDLQPLPRQRLIQLEKSMAEESQSGHGNGYRCRNNF